MMEDRFPVRQVDPAEVEADIAAFMAVSEPQRSAERLECGVVDSEAVEATDVPVLPREVFVDPQRLVDLLADSAEAHGWTVDRHESTRPALLHTALTLLQIMFPRRTCDDCRRESDNHYPCHQPGCTCYCQDSETPERMKRPPTYGGVQ